MWEYNIGEAEIFSFKIMKYLRKKDWISNKQTDEQSDIIVQEHTRESKIPSLSSPPSPGPPIYYEIGPFLVPNRSQQKHTETSS